MDKKSQKRRKRFGTESAYMTWSNGYLYGQKHPVPRWPLLGFNTTLLVTVPCHWAAPLWASGAQICHLHKLAKVILGISPLHVALRGTRRLRGMLLGCSLPTYSCSKCNSTGSAQQQSFFHAPTAILPSFPMYPWPRSWGDDNSCITGNTATLWLFLPSWEQGGAAVTEMKIRHTMQPPMLNWILQRVWSWSRSWAQLIQTQKNVLTSQWGEGHKGILGLLMCKACYGSPLLEAEEASWIHGKHNVMLGQSLAREEVWNACRRTKPWCTVLCGLHGAMVWQLRGAVCLFGMYWRTELKKYWAIPPCRHQCLLEGSWHLTEEDRILSALSLKSYTSCTLLQVHERCWDLQTGHASQTIEKWIQRNPCKPGGFE